VHSLPYEHCLGSELKDIGFLMKGDSFPHLASSPKNNKIVIGPLGKGFKILFGNDKKTWQFHTSWYGSFLPAKLTKFRAPNVNGYEIWLEDKGRVLEL
jgi:hypothetical protein